MSRSENQRTEDRQVRILKDELSSRLPSRATTVQCQMLRSRGIFATPNTHSFQDASELLDATANEVTAAQLKFAADLGIDATGLTKSELSAKIDDAVKARDAQRKLDRIARETFLAAQAALPKTPVVKNVTVSRHSKVAVIRALAARGLTAEQIAAALETANLDRAEWLLTSNRPWFDRQIADTQGKPAKLTNDDLIALGLEGVE